MKTQEELQSEKEGLLSKYKNVYSLIVPLSDDEEDNSTATLFLKKMDRITYAICVKMSQGNDPLKAVEQYIKNCYIGGDDMNLVLSNEDALLSCENQIVKLILSRKEAVLKKN